MTVLHRKGKFVFILDDDMTEVGSIFRSSDVQLVSSTWTESVAASDI